MEVVLGLDPQAVKPILAAKMMGKVSRRMETSYHLGAAISYFHVSTVKFEIGTELSGPSVRGVESRWSDIEDERYYDPRLIYLWSGDLDPRGLRTGTWTGQDQSVNYVYEVEPCDQPVKRETMKWQEWTCTRAIVIRCLFDPNAE